MNRLVIECFSKGLETITIKDLNIQQQKLIFSFLNMLVIFKDINISLNNYCITKKENTILITY